MTIQEPAVSLTDFGLALECGWFSLLVLRRASSNASLRIWFFLLFGGLSLSALAGGIAHGFIADKESLAHMVVWLITLTGLGLTGLAVWMLAADLSPPGLTSVLIRIIGSLALAAFLFVIFFRSQAFVVAIAYYAAGAIALFLTLTYRFVKHGGTFYLFGILALALTFVAATVQQMEWAIHPKWFDHNASYHLLQAIALAILFLSARGLIDEQTRLIN